MDFPFCFKKLTLGAKGEKLACKYLRKNGYKILEKNFFNKSGRRLGEIDIIAKDGQELVFVEVKTRTLTAFSKDIPPEESITRAKLYKLDKAASFYLSINSLADVEYRFDAITLIIDETQALKINHIKNIFL